MKKALIAGSTGLVGGELLEQLLADPAYEQVTALVRRAPAVQHPKLNARVVDFEKLETVADAFRVDDVYCSLGTTMKKAGSQAAFRRVDYEYPVKIGELAKAAGVQRFLLVSSAGSSAKSAIFYARIKGELEEALAALKFPVLHIFRPGLLLGERAERRIAEGISVFFTRLLGPLGRLWAVEAADVARAMRLAAGREAGGVRYYTNADINQMARQ